MRVVCLICPDCKCDDLQVEDKGNFAVNCVCSECGNEFTVEGYVVEIE